MITRCLSTPNLLETGREEFSGAHEKLIAVTVVAPAGGDPNAALTDAFSTIATDRPDALYVIEGPFARANAKAIVFNRANTLRTSTATGIAR